MPPKAQKKKMTGAEILESLEAESTNNIVTEKTEEKTDTSEIKDKAGRKKTMTETKPKDVTSLTVKTGNPRARSVSRSAEKEVGTEIPKQRGRRPLIKKAESQTETDSDVDKKNKSKPPVVVKKAAEKEVEATKTATVKTPKKTKETDNTEAPPKKVVKKAVKETASVETKEVESADTENIEEQVAKKRGRKPKMTEENPSPVIELVSESSSDTPKTRGRPKKSVAEAVPVEAIKPTKSKETEDVATEPLTTEIQKKKATKASKAETEVNSPKVVQDSASDLPKTRGRPKKSVSEAVPVESLKTAKNKETEEVATEPKTESSKKKIAEAKNSESVEANDKPETKSVRTRRLSTQKKIEDETLAESKVNVVPEVTEAKKRGRKPKAQTETVSTEEDKENENGKTRLVKSARAKITIEHCTS